MDSRTATQPSAVTLAGVRHRSGTTTVGRVRPGWRSCTEPARIPARRHAWREALSGVWEMTRAVVRALVVLGCAGAIGGCGATSIGIPKIPSIGIGAPPSAASAERYGQVTIPGQKVVFLPKGDVALSFSDFVQGGADDVENGMVPAMTLEVSGPAGGPPYPKVTDMYGTATDVNGHVWLQINTIHVLKAGKYRVSVTANTSGYINPQLLLGR